MKFTSMKWFLLLCITFTATILISCDDSSTSTNDGNKPNIISVVPDSVYQGSTITITGVRFGTDRGSGYVSIKGVNITDNTKYSEWSDTKITVTIPSDAATGLSAVTVTNGEGTSNSVNITVVALPADAPSITYIDATTASTGTKLGIYGKNFGDFAADGYVQFTGARSDNIVSWSDSKIVVIIPDNAQTGTVKVVRGGVSSNSKDITIKVNANTIPVVRITKGTFTMGWEKTGDIWDAPVHQVTINYDFYMSPTEITQELYKLATGGNPSKDKNSTKNPVEQVTFVQACKFCNWASSRESMTPCYTISDDETTVTCDFNANGYRLPTEAEWEYACRAGTTGEYSGVLNDIGWFSENSGNAIHEVGKKSPNSWGLYDMHGNVQEWCWDYYDSGYYKDGQVNPTGPATGITRAVRGGSYVSGEESCTSGKRSSVSETLFNYDLGFRIVRKI